MNFEEKREAISAITIAILKGENTFTFAGEDVTRVYQLPTPQRAGTFCQQETYARLKAKEIVNEK